MAAFLSGCCSPWHGPSTITTPEGQVMCAKHKTPLVFVRSYSLPPDSETHMDPADNYLRAASCYPNLWPFGDFRHPDEKLGATHPSTAQFCLKCEKAAEPMMRRSQ